MAYWTVSGDAKNDAAKGRAWQAHLSGVDWKAEMTRIEADAAIVRATESGSRAARKLEQFRNEWKAARNNKYFVENGRQFGG